MSPDEMNAIVDLVSIAPTAGVIIKGTGGLRKMRIPLQGRGKRDGGRIIYWFHIEGYLALLMWVFAKNEAEDLSPKQAKAFAASAANFIEELN